MNIILIGPMGSGKTTIGKELSEKLSFEFVDMDCEIEKQENMSIVDIFDKFGENKFRQLELNLLKKVLKNENTIISTGGGIIKEDTNRELLKKEEHVFFLNGNVDTLLRNLSNGINERPLLKDSDNLRGKIENLLFERYNKYEECAKIKIDINHKNIDELVSQILVYIR
ncbi:MAG: shikimate kinase [Peptostreptococcaceae bacterium]